MPAKHKRTVIGALSLGFVLTLLPAQLPKMSHATAGSAWFSEGLSLTKLDDLAAGQVPTDSVNGNTDCSEQQLITRPEWRELLPPHTLLQPATETDACVVQTAYGVADTRSANIQLFDSQQAGPLTAYVGSASVLPVPNNVMSLSFTSNGFVQVNQNTVSKLQAETNQLDHTVKYHLTGPPDFMLTDLAGHPLPTNYDSLSFSSDGRWMVINSPNHAVIRVNLSSFAIMPFAAPFDYTTSLGPNPQTAITNDGRYVVIGSASFRTLKLYDLSTCAVPPATLTGPVSCQSRDLWAFLQGQVAGLSSFSNLRFIDNDVLSLYLGAQTTSVSPLAVSKYDLAVAGHKRTQLSYLGLGDSFSSGEGAYAYEIGTDTSNNLCHLSTVSYPYLLAGWLASNSFHTVACSGALMNDVLGTGSDYNGQVKDKIPLYSRDVPAILQAFRPGYIEQIQFARHYIPGTTTITISGNDIGFADLVQECAADVLHGTCYPTYEDWLELLTTIDAQRTPLTALYNHLKRASAPTSRLYAVGYPQIVYPEGDCADNVHLNHHELTLAVRVIEQLNSVVKASAAAAGIQYIDVSQAFAGHRLCETSSHNVAVNGLTLGNDAPGFSHGPIGNESYHPNQLGHQLLAKSILAGSHNLSLPMPVKTTAVKVLPPAANPVLRQPANLQQTHQNAHAKNYYRYQAPKEAALPANSAG